MPDQPSQRRKLAAILMADVSGFSRLMGADEEGTTARMQDFHRRVHSLIESHQGRLVDTAGDSVFGEFDSVVNSVRCAYEIQTEQARENHEEADDARIDTRIGIHLGDVIVEAQRVWGDGVNIAARLEQFAQPGSICVSEAVYQQIFNKLDYEFQDMGVQELKNIDQPLRVYGIPGPGSLPVAAPSSSVSHPRTRRRAHRRHSKDPNPRGRREPSTWLEAFMHPLDLISLIIAVALITSPLLMVPTGGIFSTLGGVLAGVSLGRIWRAVSGIRGHLQIPLGVGIASGAAFTHWSVPTDGLFVVAGLIVAAVGVSRVFTERRLAR